jgi:hypothetical protein
VRDEARVDHDGGEEKPMRVDMSTVSPEQRRLILVASNDTYQALVSALDPRKIYKEALWLPVWYAYPLRIAFGAATAESEYLSTLNLILAEKRQAHQESKTKSIIKLLGRMGGQIRQHFAKGEIPIPHLPEREAAALFRFDVGHPKDGCCVGKLPHRFATPDIHEDDRAGVPAPAA